MRSKLFQQMNDGTNEQIICFPYLGGYVNAFTDLVGSLDENLDIWVPNPPGHGSCSLEPLETITDMVHLYEKELRDILKKSVPFLGLVWEGLLRTFWHKKFFNQRILMWRISNWC